MFIDGCYCHGCPEHDSMSATDLDYWSTKISRNRACDLETEPLQACGWLGSRFWEHGPLATAAARIVERVQDRLATISA